MIRPWHRRQDGSAVRPFNGFAIFFTVLFFFTAARAQSSWPELAAARSVSGQFTVAGSREPSPLLRRPELATNPALVRLEPALLAVAAERFKIAIWNQLGLKANDPWRGKIFLALHPARSTDDGITIVSGPTFQTWNYRVELPDVLPATRYARALTAVVLLEIANRNAAATGRSAELPPWLIDGLARQALAGDEVKLILSAPSNFSGGLMQSRVNKIEHGMDPLAAARRTLQQSAALTFEQLSWPGEAQVNGEDNGVYGASAQLFVSELLALKDGAVRLRALLAELPRDLNWQTAFFAAFHDDFRQPLEVEKWWSLRVIAFAGTRPGPRWTVADSRDRLAELLSVPVNFRSQSNALPTHAEISLQSAIRNLEPTQLAAGLQLKLRDLALTQLRLAPPFAALAGDYRQVLADFLEKKRPAPAVTAAGRNAPAMRRPDENEDVLKKLDALDARRREAEIRLKPVTLPKK